MVNICSSCGFTNREYADKCSRCGAPLATGLSKQVHAMADIRIFSAIYAVTAAIGTAAFIFRYVYSGQYSYAFFSTFQNISPGQFGAALAPYLYAFEILEGASAVITLTSIFFLRSGYRILSRSDLEFSSPHTGTTLILVSLVVLVLALVAIVAAILTIIPQLSQNPPVLSLSLVGSFIAAAFIALIGLVLLIVGTIMAMVLGFHRLSVKFGDSFFEGAWIFYLVALFFAPAGLVAAYLSLSGANRTTRKLKGAVPLDQEP